MFTQQTKAAHFKKPGASLARAPSNRQLGIQFLPVVAFAVNCKPTDYHREGSKRSMNGACRLDESVVHSATEVHGNVRAPA
jgi:hypothetical protein